MKQGWFPLSCLFILNFEALYSEHDPRFLCYMSWFNSWFVLLWSLPRLGIPRLLWITRGQSKELVTIAIKGEIFLSLYNPSGELSRQAQGSRFSHKSWPSSTLVVFTAAPSLSLKEDAWLHLHCGMVTHLHYTCCFHQKSRYEAHSSYEHFNSLWDSQKMVCFALSFLKQPIHVLIPSPWYHTTSLFKILDIIYSKRSTRYPG